MTLNAAMLESATALDPESCPREIAGVRAWNGALLARIGDRPNAETLDDGIEGPGLG
ncbi:MAG: hypothetical protein AAFW60_06530 [Pseudomonadota bacterium]